MNRYFTCKQILVLGTSCLACLVLGAGWFYYTKKLPTPVHIEIAGCPVLGEKGAPVHMVLFEDFRCGSCKSFNLQLLPKIQAHYIDPGYARFTIVPLAFIQGSKPLANSALAVYHIAPDRLLSYMHGLCQGFGEIETRTSTHQQLINLAKSIGGIDLLQFKTCVMTDCYEAILEKNLILAKEIMGKEFGTPMLYINGIPGSIGSFEAIQAMMDQFLQGKL
jgi:protein-disulfide isomerase